MVEQSFVGREQEIDRLQGLLRRALDGEMQIAFVVGDAGSGKSTLLQEFADRAEDADTSLVVAVGTCNAQTGDGDPYLPWREVLAQLTGDIETRLSQKQITAKNATRLKEMLRVSGATLLEFGPDLIGTLVPGASLVGRIATYAAEQVGVTDRLKKQVAETAQAASAVPTDLDQSKIFQQYTNVLLALAKNTPIIVILDDLQWADAPSLNLLFHQRQMLMGQKATTPMPPLTPPEDMAASLLLYPPGEMPDFTKRPNLQAERQPLFPLDPLLVYARCEQCDKYRVAALQEVVQEQPRYLGLDPDCGHSITFER